MQRRRTAVWVLAAAALCASACGASNGAMRAGAESGKPDDERGGETLVFPVSAERSSARGDEPSRGAVELVLYNPSPIGPLSEAALRGYRVYAEIENVGDEPLALTPAYVRAVVTENGLARAGCAGDAIRVTSESAVATGGSLFVSVPLPCALEEPGDYEVAITYSAGAPPGEEGTTLERTLSTPLRVDGTLPPFEPGELPPVE